MIDLKALAAEAIEVASKATEGPWFLGYRSICSEPLSREYQRLEADVPPDADDNDPRWDALPDFDICAMPVVAGDTPTRQGTDDAALICLARASLPLLAQGYLEKCAEAERLGIKCINLLNERDELSGEVERLRKEDEEWSVLCNQQHAMLEELTAWPPTGIACGWCVRAAGDDDAARKAAQSYTLDEVRAHANVCPHNPAVIERDSLRAELAAIMAARDEALAALDAIVAETRPVQASVWYMHDNHTFTRLYGDVDSIVDQARQIAVGSPYGMLGSVKLMDRNDRELRTVGDLIHAGPGGFQDADLMTWRGAVLADPVVPGLLAAEVALRKVGAK